MAPLSLRTLLASPELAPDGEQRLARAARGGDQAARSELIQSSLRLVAMRIRNLRIRADDVDDALQAGAVGLIAAVDRFDPDRGVRLATFAWPWITAAIRAAAFPVQIDVPTPVCEQDSGAGVSLAFDVARLPVRMAEVLRLRFRLGEPPDLPRSHADIAACLGLSIGQVRRAEAQALGRLRARLATLGDRNPL